MTAPKNPAKNPQLRSLLHVGADAATVEATRKAVLDIISAPHTDERTKRAALKALASTCSVSNVTISDTQFTA